MTTVKIPVGGNQELPETEEQRLAREAAEAAAAEASKGKTPEQIAAEAAEAEAAAEAAKKKKEEDDAAAAAAAKAESKVQIQNEDGSTAEYTVNEAGDAVDANGKVVYTAAQLAEFEEDDNATQGASIEDISKVSGIQILDESGKPKAYETSIEGFAEREMDIKRLGYEEGVNKALADFFAANPEFESMHKFKRTYGSLDNYSEFVDYSKVTLDKGNEQQLLDVIIKAEMAKGTSKERATKLANFSKADNTLYTDAEESLKFLTTNQAKDIEAANKREQEAINEAIRKESEYFGIAADKNGKPVVLNVEGSIYDMVVVKGQIGNIGIPKDGLKVKDGSGTLKHFTREQIFDYIYTPIAEIDGELYSQAQIDEYKRLSDKNNLVASYIHNLLGGDVSQLVEIGKRSDNVKNVRTLKHKSSNPGAAPAGGSKKVIIPIR